MFSKEMEALIEATLEDGVLTDQKKTVLLKRAEKEGIDVDELDVYIQSLLRKRHNAEAEADAIEDRKSKMGSIKKCPNCGMVIQPGWAICPSCGMAFSETASSSAYKKFYEEVCLMDATANAINVFTGGIRKKISKKANFIQSYPVPNTRVDLLEFLTNLKPLCDINMTPATKQSLDKINFGYHYMILYQNCISKARISFLNDPDFQEFFEFEKKELAKKELAKKSSTNKKRIAAGIVVAILLSVLGWLIFVPSKDGIIADQTAHVTSLVKKNKLAEADEYLVNISFLDFKGDAYVVEKYDAMFFSVINAYIKKDDLVAAESLGLVYKSKIGNDMAWKDSSCYLTLKSKFKKEGRDFSALASKYDFK